MIWIYLILQAVGLGIIAWTFKTEDKDEHAIPFEIGGLLSLCWVVIAAPLPVKLLTGFLMVRFRSQIHHAFAGGQDAILSFFKTGLPALTKIGSTNFEPVSWLMPESVTRFLKRDVLYQWPDPLTTHDQYGPSTLIDIDAVDTTAHFR